MSELDDYLRCGPLEHGFLRVRCDTCHHENLLALSCKHRGPCPFFICCYRWTACVGVYKVAAPKGWQQPEIAESARPFEPDPVSTGVGIGKRLGLRGACQIDAICLGPQ